MLNPFLNIQPNSLYWSSLSCILVPVHMLKLARNVFAELSLSSEKGEIKFDYVKTLQNLQEVEGLKLANKISRAHIIFFWQ